jgi:cell division septation protein DedD
VEGSMEKQEKIIELLNELKKKQFTGFIRINFSQGGITRIEKNEEILKKAKI